MVRPPRAWSAAAWAVLFVTSVVVAGCAAGTEPGPGPTPTTGPSTHARSPTSVASVPPDGVSLKMLGFDNGPVGELSIPRSATVSDRVDQPNAVTVVMTSPPTAQIAAYYRRALPATGFTITKDDPTTNTLTFTGHGWTGALTGSGEAAAVSVRPT